MKHTLGLLASVLCLMSLAGCAADLGTEENPYPAGTAVTYEVFSATTDESVVWQIQFAEPHDTAPNPDAPDYDAERDDRCRITTGTLILIKDNRDPNEPIELRHLVPDLHSRGDIGDTNWTQGGGCTNTEIRALEAANIHVWSWLSVTIGKDSFDTTTPAHVLAGVPVPFYDIVNDDSYYRLYQPNDSFIREEDPEVIDLRRAVNLYEEE